MCDTLVAAASHTADGAVWFAKNSDREPGEAQAVDHLPRQTWGAAKLQCTYLEIPQASVTNEIVISRPFWMWGAEIGANEHGVCIGNEAVWTRLPVEPTGLTGMDLLRLALERSSTALEALELITGFLKDYGQGGSCGYRNKKFRYHNSFLLADPTEAWVLETAGKYWAAERVTGIRTISNVLSIGKEFDRLSDGAFEFARSKGWCRSAADFDFAKAFGDAAYRSLTGGLERSACTLQSLTPNGNKPRREDFLATLRSHNGQSPLNGWKMTQPCAHSSWVKTRRAGQTTGSMVSRLTASQQSHWMTGTSSPCLSVFKPVVLGGGPVSTGKPPAAGYDRESLYWRHERLHRRVLENYEARKASFNTARLALEASFMSTDHSNLSAGECSALWEEHREVIADWLSAVEKTEAKRHGLSLFNRYWAKQDDLDEAAPG